MQHSHMDQKIQHVLFEPHLTPRPGEKQNKMKDISGGIHLGTIVEQLVFVTDLLRTELPYIEFMIRKTHEVANMNPSKLKKVSRIKCRIELSFSNICV